MWKDEDERERRRQRDEFWNMDELMPNVPRRHNGQRASGATEAVEIELGGDNGGRSAPQDIPLGRHIPGKKEAEEYEFYEPNHPFIRRVGLSCIPSGTDYYGQFLRHAQRIRELRGKPCAPVPFFSYMPEYSQLTKAQLDWYLWWREQVWHGEYPEVDYSYIMLYTYELINTGGHSSPQWGVHQLCELWRAYHEEYSRLNWLMAEWICDFSLIWKLPAPAMPHELVDVSSMKEFYIGGEKSGENGRISSDALITYCSLYNYKTSKFVRGDARKLCEEHIPAAIEAIIPELYDEGGSLRFVDSTKSYARTRIAFPGALRTDECHRRIKVEYVHMSQIVELRLAVTDAVRYAENRLRAYLGAKSRLGIKQLPPRIKARLDEYFDRELPLGSRRSPRFAQPDYERLYDVPKTAFSTDEAERIERESWQTTERLLQAFGGEGIEVAETAETVSVTEIGESFGRKSYKDGTLGTGNVAARANEQRDAGRDGSESLDAGNMTSPAPDFGLTGASEHTAPASASDESGASGLAAALGEYMDFVRLVDSRDTAGQREFARRRGEMTDHIFDKINEISVDFFGDVILIEGDNGFEIVEDYRGELFYE